ncbi:beta-1,6-N-acetylglucosaminyltransferase [Pedobacter sp. MW01-1-1]|uniref:beta-1,6-N-acetylglucosaminyltransferase n=1 Tax=Pedobacter sp. MW01-1-1 TaxID=3383027 RepID=UPI003FEE5552
MKIAHIIMAHKNPEQIKRLIESLNHPNFYFFIHLDKKVSIQDFEFIGTLPRVHFIKKRISCNWAGYSFVEAMLSATKEVLESGQPFSHINMLSGQDYPIKNVNEIDDFFKQNTEKSFLTYQSATEESWWEHAKNRVEDYHFIDFSYKGRYFVQWLANAILPKRTFPLNVKLYGKNDSSWWAITSDCAKYLVQFVEKNTKLQRFMRYTWGSDEFLIPTVLLSSIFANTIVNNNLRQTDWSAGGANPKIFLKEDFKSLATSDKLFARKFDQEVDSEILDQIDAQLLGI